MAWARAERRAAEEVKMIEKAFFSARDRGKGGNEIRWQGAFIVAHKGWRKILGLNFYDFEHLLQIQANLMGIAFISRAASSVPVSR